MNKYSKINKMITSILAVICFISGIIVLICPMGSPDPNASVPDAIASIFINFSSLIVLYFFNLVMTIIFTVSQIAFTIIDIVKKDKIYIMNIIAFSICLIFEIILFVLRFSLMI